MNTKAVKNAPVQGTGANTNTASKINNRPSLTGKEAKNEAHENKAPAQAPQVEEAKAPETKADNTVTVDNQPANLAEAPKAEEVKQSEEAQPQAEEAKAEPTKEQHFKVDEAQAVKPVLTLEAKLKAVDNLHRASLQRNNLISRMKEIESFEVNLKTENDELNDNPFQGCKLIIEDDKKRQFVTTTPGLIRLVAQFIYNACEEKKTAIEAQIIFPNA